MDATAFIKRLQADRHYRGQVVGIRDLPPRRAIYREPRKPLPDQVRTLLAKEGIERLYAHQADTYDAVAAGEHVVIATGTASGKSLGYYLPLLAGALEHPEYRALYLAPAKALAYDQLDSLTRFVEAGDLAEYVRPACYDGDTPQHKRQGIRRSANVLLSNPDMLHVSILPYHAKWAAFFANLRLVVLDEIHMYRGIFGSHVAGVLRRLRRVCRHWQDGREPQFICCSATLGNPRELAQRLTGQPMTLIDEDASPRGRRVFVLWNPPLLEEERHKRPASQPTFEPQDVGASQPTFSLRYASPAAADGVPAALGPTGPTRSHPLLARPTTVKVVRRSGNVEAQELMQRLIEADAPTITFCKARVVAELIYKYLTEALQRRRPDLARRVRPYRGGYLPNERRAIEAQLFSGELLGVCCTTALELGIDVGSLDAALLVGFPGTFCSLWQQAGRAGRRQDESLVIFIGYDDPIDQYLMRHPDFLFSQPLEQAIVDPDNPHILAAQLACAAFELPLEEAEVAALGGAAPEVTAVLTEAGQLRKSAERYYWAQSEFPAARTSLRTISNATFAIVDTTGGRNEVIGQVDSISAPELVYPEAVYLHQGESYLVRELDLPLRTARVTRLDADYYTQPVLADECRIVAERLTAACAGGKRSYGDVRVKWQTIAFRKFKLYTQDLIGQTTLDLPAQQIDTAGVWLEPPPEALAAVRDAGHKAFEGLSGVRNLLMVALPTLAMCDRYDIGGVVNSSQLGVSVIILYDRYQGGVGYAKHGYDCALELLQMAHELVRGCPCEDGCPACVAPPNLRIAIHHDPDLGQGYRIPDKAATLALLGAWVG